MKKLLVIAVALMSVVNTVVAQQKQDSPWKEVQVVDIPSNLPIYQGVTKNGNPKYWFDFKGLQVTVSPGSAAKYKDNTTTLLLVKWQHQESGKIKYSTRQKSVAKNNTPNIDLNKLF